MLAMVLRNSKVNWKLLLKKKKEKKKFQSIHMVYAENSQKVSKTKYDLLLSRTKRKEVALIALMLLLLLHQ